MMLFLNKIIFKYILCLTSIFVTIKAQQTCVTPSYEDGYCVSYRECQFVNDLYTKHGDNIPQYLLDYIVRSRCSMDNEPVRLCCKREQVVVSSNTATPAKSTNVDDTNYNLDYVSQLNPQGLKILNGLRCGDANDNRVAGGNVTKLNEYPWMALLAYDSPGERFKCGGTLIANNYILTAAHCVVVSTDPVVGVRLGEHDLTAEIDCDTGLKRRCAPAAEDFGIQRIIVHPKYNVRKRVNDVALIQLDRSAQFRKEIRPICLPITANSLSVNYNDRFIVAGWGRTEHGSAQSDVLLKAFLKVSKLSYCQNLFKLEVNLKHICAGDLQTGRDSCKGDSGGPLFQLAPYKMKNKFIQYGIISFGGVACNLTQLLPSLYTNVITFMPWITSNIV